MATSVELARDDDRPLDVRFAKSSVFGRLISIFWEAHGAFPHVRERVLPTSDVFLIVNLGAPHFLISAEGHTIHSDAWVAGIQQSALITGALDRADVWGVKLSPRGAQLAFGSIAVLADSVVDLGQLLGAAGLSLAGRLRDAGSFEMRCRLFEQHLESRLKSGGSKWRPEVGWAFDRIVSDPSTRISDMAAEIGWSRKHLHAQFVQHLGHSPKAITRVIRFERALHLMASQADMGLAEIALAAGYSDQPQFTREFRAHAGITPKTYARSRVADVDYGFVDADG